MRALAHWSKASLAYYGSGNSATARAVISSRAKSSAGTGLLTEPVVLADADGRVQFANAAASSLLGYRPEELSGLPLTALIHESEREKFVVELAALERVPSDFASLEHSAAVLCKNGTRLAVMLTLSRRIAVTRSVTTMVLRQL